MYFSKRSRWSPRNAGTYGFGSDSNDERDLRPEGEPERERWHNREFYQQGEGYTTAGSRYLRDLGVDESEYAGAHHHVSPSAHGRWEHSLHQPFDTQFASRHGWSFGFDRMPASALTHEGPHAGKGPKNYRRSDERIFEEVCERLMRSGDVDASDVEVNVESGEVRLSGSVESRRTKRIAEDILEGIAGVSDIRNELKVRRQ